jgi:outer membrane protein assembly factor BamB
MDSAFRRLAIAASLAVSVMTFAGVASSADRKPLAKHLLEIANKAKGVCLVPRGGDLAMDLARGSELVVVSQEAGAAQAAAMRAKADQAGLLGRSMYVAEAEAGTPVLADNYANVLVIADATDELLTRLDAKAMLRALTPHGGKAIVGLAKGSAGVLARTKIEAWAKGFGAAETKVIEDDFGLWAVVTKPQLPGAAEWTHRLFDAGFNPVSTDTAFTMPSMTQWLDTPYNHGPGAPRIAGGRLLLVMEGRYNSRPECDVNFLIMRDAYNGAVLWKRDMGEQYAADYYLSSVVMTSDAVYVVDMPNPTVLVLNPDTGAELRRIDCSSLGKQVKWIALRDGVLFAAGGNTDHTGGAWSGVFGAQHVKFLRDKEDNLKDSVAVGNNRMVGAFDPQTGNALWTHDEAQDCIPEFFLAVRNGRVYFMAQEKYAGSLDAKTGELIWKNPDAAAIYKSSLHPQFAVSSGALEVSDSTLLFARPGSARIALNAEDGKMLWSTPKYGGHQQCGSLIWDKYVLGQKSVNLRTGEPEFTGKGANPYIGACTFLCATERYITAMPGVTFDLKAMKPVARPTFFHKGPCSMGSVVGEGVLFIPSFHCTCSYQLNGNIVEMSGDARQYQKPAVESERLTLSAKPDPTAPLVLTGADWPAFRAGNARSNASAALVPGNAAPRWAFTRKTPYTNPQYPSDRSETSHEPAQPIAVGNLAITSGPDGVVRALDLASGKPTWTFYTGGQIAQSPAVAEGRAYVPSDDGFLYCLEAATGRELWRFRAAPAERRMMAFGHLVSTWPLFAGVLVQDGVVYTAASLLNMNATHVYALDARTGRIVWQNNTSGLPDEKSEDGATAVGTLTVAQGRLWIRTTSYDLKTGKHAQYADPKAHERARWVNVINGGNALLHRNTGVIQGRFLVFGGRRFYESQSRPLPIGRSGQPLSIIELNADGTGIFPQLDLVNYTGAFAAWDDRQLIAAPAMEDKASVNGALRHSPILCWDLAKTIAAVQAKDAATVKLFGRMDKWETVGQLPNRQWLLDAHRTYAVAICPNAVVAAYGMMDAPEKLKAVAHVVSTKWHLAALDRATGNELWKQPLPSEPVYDGVCIARDGSVLVQLLDGGVVCMGKRDTQ